MLSSKPSDLAPVLDRVKLALDVLAKNEDADSAVTQFVVTKSFEPYWRLFHHAGGKMVDDVDLEEEIAELDSVCTALLDLLEINNARFKRGVERLGATVRQLYLAVGMDPDDQLCGMAINQSSELRTPGNMAYH